MSSVKIQGNASGTGVLTITAPNTNTDRALTIPDSGGEILTSSNSTIVTTTSISTTSINANNLTGSVEVANTAPANTIVVSSAGAVTVSGDVSVGGNISANTATGDTLTDTSNSGSVTLDFSAWQNFVLTLTGNITLVNPTTEQVGQSGFIAFKQDGTGSRTVSLGTDYETAAGAGLTLTSTASATDIVPYVVIADGRILLGTPQLAFS